MKKIVVAILSIFFLINLLFLGLFLYSRFSEPKAFVRPIYQTNVLDSEKPAEQISLSENLPGDSKTPYGKHEKINETDYVSYIQPDEHMATPEEIFIALNNYRSSNGKNALSWDNDLATWAQQRSQFFSDNGLDQHKGFNSQAPTMGPSLRLKRANENSSLGHKIEAVHLIEWIHAQDDPHKTSLLGNFTAVGIGVASGSQGYGTDIILGIR